MKGDLLFKRIINCSRCGRNHRNVVMKKLKQDVYADTVPDRIIYTHWAPCPTNRDPILGVVVEDDE